MACYCGMDGLRECRECAEKREAGEERSAAASENNLRPSDDIDGLRRYNCAYPAMERIHKYILELENRLGVSSRGSTNV